MTYQTAMEYMEEISKRGSILGLGPVKDLLNRLENPQNQCKVIHVAGTNGKGSICTFLEAMYREEGKRVGRYISPTIHCYLERFQINGIYMEEDCFARLVARIQQVVTQMQKEGVAIPTAFEIETAIAFLYFVEEQVDLVILETGMGGRQDATNVVEKPLCTVFASIGMDHMQFLGDTIEKIAYEKAGIMRKGTPVVSYPNSSEVLAILENEYSLHKVGCKRNDTSAERDEKRCNLNEEQVEFYVADASQLQIVSQNLEESIFCYRGVTYRIKMLGEYQIYNAITAIETKLLLDGHLKPESLQKATWEGRFEKMSDKPIMIRDGAHNIDGVNALKVSLQKHFTNERIIFIIGVLRDKEYEKMMAVLGPLASKVFTVTPQVARGLSGEVLKECILPYCEDVIACESLDEAKSLAKEAVKEYEKQGEQAIIVASGSLSYIGQMKE